MPESVTATPSAISSRFPLIGRLLLAFCVFGGLTLADTLDPVSINSSEGGSIWMNEKNVATDVYFAGVINIQVVHNGTTYTRETLCVDLFTDINIGTTYYTVDMMPSAIPPADPEKDLLSVSWLIDNAMLPGLYPGQYTSALPTAYYITTSNTTAGTSVQRGEALQLAVWDMTVDGGDGFSKGNVQASNTTGEVTDPVVLFDAQFYEAAALGQFTDNADVYVNWSGNANQKLGTAAQMLEGPLYTTGPQPLGPEPATFVLVGTALIAIGWSWRRRMRKPASGRA